ncbi:Thymidylate kinase [Aquisphaera giovannonii]|uniref:Thymidylate kinase n=1 Tax=Aquisphaera giovannonii TaxID=406548 RepID=A0A5B9VXW2_9BACT|nr:dTMP kinase [Aquisphaera giovannonii]QEH33132.1 Thymidylate kinase [Aquisphaera giovannonii]
MPEESTAPSTPRPHPHPGFFLALEGPDGGGKTTQAARLVAWLREAGLDVVACHDPGSTVVGERLRQIVLDRASVHLSIRAEVFIYMASRAQLVDEVIRPSLAAGRVVVTDRFLLSSLVYQGYAGGLPLGLVADLGRAATDGLLPDLTLILDVPLDAARRRVGPGRDRIEDRPDSYRRLVREGFLDVAGRGGGVEPAAYAAPVAVLDAQQDAEAVFDRIKSEVGRVLGIGPRA